MCEDKIIKPFDFKATIQSENEINEDMFININIVNAPSFWEKGNYGRGIKVAIIDTGCDINHPELKDRIVDVRNFTSDDNSDPSNVTDYVGHGTHCAGIIAASGYKFKGMAPQCDLYILKALSKNGGLYGWISNAINYAINCKVDIISMSLGGEFDDNLLHDAIKKAVNNGISIVCAAGNNGDNNSATIELNYPAAYRETISVGSINGYNKVDSYFSCSNPYIDLVAPGEDIYSTYPNSQYAKLSGTSMAAPHVAGALALLKNWSKTAWRRDLTEAEIYAQLIKRTESLNGDKYIEGNGILNLNIK